MLIFARRLAFISCFGQPDSNNKAHTQWPSETNQWFLPLLTGIAGFVAAGVIGAYKYRNRGTMSTSVFLMQLRVAAQGTVVGCLTVGLAYSMAKEYLFDKAPKDK